MGHLCSFRLADKIRRGWGGHLVVRNCYAQLHPTHGQIHLTTWDTLHSINGHIWTQMDTNEHQMTFGGSRQIAVFYLCISSIRCQLFILLASWLMLLLLMLLPFCCPTKRGSPCSLFCPSNSENGQEFHSAGAISVFPFLSTMF